MGKRIREIAEHLVRRGNRRRLRQLLRKHRELRTCDEANLIDCALSCQRGMLRWLLEQGVSPDCRWSAGGNTPLMDAAANGDLSLIELLLTFGADPNALNECSENSLGFAVAWKQAEAIPLLIAAGADVNNLEDAAPGHTQLDHAYAMQWQHGIDALRAAGGKRFVELNK